MAKKIILKEYIRGTYPKSVRTDDGVEYRRVGKGNKVGVMIALDSGEFGFSLVSPEETFDEKVSRVIKFTRNGMEYTKVVEQNKWTDKAIWDYGTCIAIERAEGDLPIPSIVPKFAERQIKRFKEKIEHHIK